MSTEGERTASAIARMSALLEGVIEKVDSYQVDQKKSQETVEKELRSASEQRMELVLDMKLVKANLSSLTHRVGQAEEITERVEDYQRFAKFGAATVGFLIALGGSVVGLLQYLGWIRIPPP